MPKPAVADDPPMASPYERSIDYTHAGDVNGKVGRGLTRSRVDDDGQ
jgi:hypothetical protein